MLIDARSVSAGSEFLHDVCVVGSGPAGMAVAERLRGSGLQVCLLESGGRDPELRTQRLYGGSNVGHPYFRLDACRFRVFGGTSNRWGGWCRPLQPVDFERRDWMPYSGWPIDAQTLSPYYEETARLFQLVQPSFALADWQQRLPAPFALGDETFENAIFQHSPETNFAEIYGPALLDDPNVTTYLHANLTAIELEPGTNRVGRLRVQALGRRPFNVRAKATVLAAGGIENARLLLASQADRPDGLGNENCNVGRFFMEHLHVPAGHIVCNGRAPDRSFYRKATYDGAIVRGIVTPSEAAQRRYHLSSTSISIERYSYAFGTPYVGWPPPLTFGPIRLYRALRRRGSGLAGPFKTALEGAYSVRRRWSTLQASRAALARTSPDANGARRLYSLYFRAEQRPTRDSRVFLGERRDACGVPRAQLDWRVDPADTQSILAWLARLDTTLAAGGIGRVVMPDAGWDEGIIGGPHHMGTTRMSADPKNGVVDEHCRVHSVDNLYVAGSSLFATAGYANPTFTLVALALRLADHLRGRLT
ncbi:MAG: GMC oxidoreductase [Vulcanimicrobiaceae bacterium]